MEVEIRNSFRAFLAVLDRPSYPEGLRPFMLEI